MLQDIKSFATGLAVWPFFEYAFHGWVGHNPKSRKDAYAAHQAHHHYPEYFDEYTTLSDSLGRTEDYVPEVFGAMLALLVPVFGWRKSLAFALGMGTGFVALEWHHLDLHKREPKNAFEEWIWRNHFVHHFKNPQSNQGGFPLWDFVLGTYQNEPEVRVPAQKAPPWLKESRKGYKVIGKRAA